MATRLSSSLQLITDYTQAEEDILAATLSGAPIYSVIIFNTTLVKKRFWGGSAFASVPDANYNSLPLVTTSVKGVVPATGTPSGKYLKDDLTWGYVLSIAQAEINFGLITQTEYNTSVTVIDSNIDTASLITCCLSATATTDHSIDEAMISGINVMAGNIQDGVGFDILAYCDSGTFGKYKINYTIKY